jgi:hypothetical protein
MTKIEYPKEFDRYKYLSEISSKYFYINKNKLLEKIIPKCYKNTITIKVLFEYFRSNKIGNFDTLFKNISFEELVTGRFKTIKIIKEKIKSSKEIKENEYLAFLFNYSNLQGNKIKPFFENNLLISTCYYCNIDFINTYNTRSEKKNKFTLDHYFDKSTYPYLALSLYNLIPSCYTCNSKLKGVIEFNNIAPSSKKYDFDKKVKFKITLDDSCQNLQIKNKNNIDINLKENYSNEFTKFTKDMFLNERYKAHKDIVYDMITKAELYPESRLKELQNLTGIPFQQIKKDIFNLIDENEDLSKKPFSKLIKDISEEIGIT